MPAQLLTEPQPWRRLARTVCMIRPHGDLLPHRIPNGTTVLLKTAPLAGSEPVPYLLVDQSALGPGGRYTEAAVAGLDAIPAHHLMGRLVA